MTSAYRDVPEARRYRLFYRETMSVACIASHRASVRLILNRGHGVTQNGDKIVGVVKINIHARDHSVASILFSLSSFFFFYSVLFSSCAEVGSRTKANGIGPLRAPLATKRVFCSRLPIAYTLLPRGNDFRVRVCPTHSSRFLSSRTVPPLSSAKPG